MQVYGVSEFVKGINQLLQDIPVCVQGEVSNFRVTQNRFVWFDLKDDKSYVSCFLLAFQLEHPLQDGQAVQVFGSPGLFAKSGRFHLRVNKIQVVGAGTIQQKYEALKAKLEAEGMFDVQRKRPLPRFPQRIGLVTSTDAAAYSDVLKILKNRWAGLEIVHFPVQVQGDRAPASLVTALQYLNKHEAKQLDVVIITRGGGSMEDLQAFNDEKVVRALFSLKVPTIAAIGHERDTALVELAADVRASTPSNAAEMAVPDKRDVCFQLAVISRQNHRALTDCVNHYRTMINSSMTIFDDHISRVQQNVASSIQRFHLGVQSWEHAIQLQQQQLDHTMILLQSYHPKHVLKRGYSITTLPDGTIVTSAQKVPTKQLIRTQLSDGEFRSTVL